MCGESGEQRGLGQPGGGPSPRVRGIPAREGPASTTTVHGEPRYDGCPVRGSETTEAVEIVTGAAGDDTIGADQPPNPLAGMHRDDEATGGDGGRRALGRSGRRHAVRRAGSEPPDRRAGCRTVRVRRGVRRCGDHRLRRRPARPDRVRFHGGCLRERRRPRWPNLVSIDRDCIRTDFFVYFSRLCA